MPSVRKMSRVVLSALAALRGDADVGAEERGAEAVDAAERMDAEESAAAEAAIGRGRGDDEGAGAGVEDVGE